MVVQGHPALIVSCPTGKRQAIPPPPARTCGPLQFEEKPGIGSTNLGAYGTFEWSVRVFEGYPYLEGNMSKTSRVFWVYCFRKHAFTVFVSKAYKGTPLAESEASQR